MKINYPILYCCYNRLELIKKSIDVIKNIECKKIYISIDGPKNDYEDLRKNTEIIKFLSSITFKSEKEILIRKKNLGCKIAMSKSIDWFFDREEAGIILEEDILPSESFFNFCEFALKKYKNSESVMMISGTNYLGAGLQSNRNFFSEHFLIWGWASWRRAWKYYDVNMKNWKNNMIKEKIKRRYSIKEYNFLNERFNSFFHDYSDTWDIQWYFACIENNGYTVMPEANLVSNFGVEGTHSNEYYKTLFLKTGKVDIQKLIPPDKIERNLDFDMKLHKKFNFKNNYLSKLRSLFKRFFFNL